MGVHRVGSTVNRHSQGRIREPLGAQQMKAVDETQVLIDGTDNHAFRPWPYQSARRAVPGRRRRVASDEGRVMARHPGGGAGREAAR